MHGRSFGLGGIDPMEMPEAGYPANTMYEFPSGEGIDPRAAQYTPTPSSDARTEIELAILSEILREALGKTKIEFEELKEAAHARLYAPPVPEGVVTMDQFNAFATQMNGNMQAIISLIMPLVAEKKPEAGEEVETEAEAPIQGTAQLAEELAAAEPVATGPVTATEVTAEATRQAPRRRNPPAK